MSYAPGPHKLSILPDTTDLKLECTTMLLEVRISYLIQYVLEPGTNPKEWRERGRSRLGTWVLEMDRHLTAHSSATT